MPSFYSTTDSRMGVNASKTPVATHKQLTLTPFICVSTEKEEEVYQPARVAGMALGPVLLVASTRLPKNEGLLKAVTGMAGFYLVAYNLTRFLEVKGEIARYRKELSEDEK
jgi:hypothetical protein